MIRFHKPYINLNEKDLYEIKEIFNNGWVSSGKYVNELEQVLKKRYNVKNAIPCANATTGLTIAIKSANWKQLDLFLPSFTWPSTLYAIRSTNNFPRFVDININTLLMNNVDDDCYSVPVDTFGARYSPNNFEKTIIDAAHGFDVKDLGNRSIVEVMSLSHTKTVTGVEGGIIFTNDDKIANKARELVRLSSRMEEINAFIALKSINNYDFELKTLRNKIFTTYKNGLSVNKNINYVKYPAGSNPSVFAIIFDSVKDRDIVVNALNATKIEYKIYYEPLLVGFENSDFIFNRILCLPCYPEIIDKQADIINIILNSTNYYNKTFLT